METTSILVVDSNNRDLDFNINRLNRWGYWVMRARDGIEGLEQFQNHSPKLVITEYAIGGMNGERFIEKIKEKTGDVPVILLAKDAPKEVVVNIFRYEHLLILRKPIDDDRLQESIKFLIAKSSQRIGPEHRKYKRVDCNIAATLLDYGSVNITNLSVGGCFLFGTYDLPAGFDVYLQIKKLEGITISAEIVWKTVNKVTGMVGLGLRFGRLDKEDIRAIGKYIYVRLATST